MSTSPLATPCAIGLGGEDRRAEVHVQADDAHARIADHAAGDVEDGVDVEAELDALDAGVGLGVRLGRQVGIDAQGHRSRLAQTLRHVGEGVQLGFALDVEEARRRSPGRSATRRRSCRRRRRRSCSPGAAGCQGAIQFAAAGHVEAGAVLGHEPADVQVAVGLDAVADERIARRRRPAATGRR